MPIKQPMNSGIKDGKLVIDMAEADELWNSMSMEQQYEAMCIMFQPLLDRATAMQRALQQLKENAAGEWVPASVVHAIADAVLDQS
ncbi:hypothetical protein [Pseudophaeobacter sp. 1A09344]|uniref:hypothetical protein n=1 Tax=Pseudophaeobacter sp. 1A09344 TaxID=3098144 RepID=UPI0034D3F0B4